VGVQVAAYFPVPVGGKYVAGAEMEQRIFTGVVKKYGTPLSPDDVPLYHVVFEDGDEQDFNEAELKLGVELFNSHQADLEENLDFEEVKPKAKKAKSSAPSVKASKAKVTSPASVVKEEKTSGRGRSRPPGPKEKKEKAPVMSKKAAVKTESSARKSMAEELAEVGVEDDADDPVWTVHHDSVGKRVAQHFAVPAQKGQKPVMQVFGGTVAVYAPPSAPRENDQLYHIVWDDGDEQDFDEADLKRALSLLDQLMPTDLHRLPDAARELVRAKQKEMAPDFAEVRAPVVVQSSSASSGSKGSGTSKGVAENSDKESAVEAAGELVAAESAAPVGRDGDAASKEVSADAVEEGRNVVDAEAGDAEMGAEVPDSVTEDGEIESGDVVEDTAAVDTMLVSEGEDQ
jgi:predicted NAD-dependent protein-ADP-ribosyltransferase YbiA (DUF1768 family)